MMAATGQSSALVRPRKVSTPCLNGSVLDLYHRGVCVMGERHVSRSTASADFTVNSPALINSKTPCSRQPRASLCPD